MSDITMIRMNKIDMEMGSAPVGTSAAMADNLTGYLREIGRYPRLSFEEEQTLSKQVMAGNAAQEQLEAGAQGQDLQALQNAVRLGRRAQEQLVDCNLRLVVVMAKPYQNRGLSLLDLIQEGNLGLMKAAARYDASTGNRFSTCASWWIRQGIGRAVADQGRAIRLPANVHQKVTRLNRARRELSAELGREPSVEELALETGFTLKKVKQLLDWGVDTTSLDINVNDDDSTTLGDLAAGCSPMDAVEEQMTHTALKRVLRHALAELDERERLVLVLRFGLNGESQTLEAVSQKLNLTRERVRQIEKRALRLLKNGTSGEALQAFIA